MRRRDIFAAVVLLGALIATITGPAAAIQLEDAPTDPALFDLELALSNLDEINTEVARLRGEVDEILQSIDGLTIERDFIELNQQGRNERLQEARTQARNMSIDAYIGIGPPASGIVVLDAQSANDLAYRNGLLRHQAERLQTAAQTYALLSGEADGTVLTLADSINDGLRQAEALNRDLARQTDRLTEAEWVVSIAEIHAEADAIFERTRRAEPTPEQWAQLRFCESTETYNIDTGNTFYGAYQFTWETWGTVGGDANPAHAPPAEQDARARKLYADRGSQPWPICGRFLP